MGDGTNRSSWLQATAGEAGERLDGVLATMAQPAALNNHHSPLRSPMGLDRGRTPLRLTTGADHSNLIFTAQQSCCAGYQSRPLTLLQGLPSATDPELRAAFWRKEPFMANNHRSQIARIGALSMHARHDAREVTSNARSAFLARFYEEVDPEGKLPPKERERRARCALRAHMSRLALKSARARSARGGKGGTE